MDEGRREVRLVDEEADGGGVAVELGAQPLYDERSPELPDPERNGGEHLGHPADADLIDQQVAAEPPTGSGTHD